MTGADQGSAATPGGWRAGLLYLLMILAAAAAFIWIRRAGEQLEPPSVEASSGSGVGVHASRSSDLTQVLLALAAIILAARLIGWGFAYLGQPPVIGEVIAGILLGPSLLGHVWPQAYQFLLPASVLPFLAVIAQIGVILYMFLVGLELDAGRLRARAQTTIAISHTGIVLPFVLGLCLALFLYPRLAPQGPFTSFALFMGVALSVTAFPVLARILSDRGLSKTELGIIALSCAAADDVTAWCLLAFVVGVARAEVANALLVSVLSLGYVAFMFVLVRPLAARFADYYESRPEEKIPQGAVAAVLLAVLLSALATEAIGIHAVFGAFLLGAVLPHGGKVARAFVRKLQDVVTILFLPAFFAYTGARTEIGLVAGWEQWLICLLIIVVATAGKFGGSLAAARLTGLGWRPSAALGVLMNTRGLMELIVLNIGLDLGVISPTLFAMMVIMALVTTLMTTPLLRVLTDRQSFHDLDAGASGPGAALTSTPAQAPAAAAG